MTDPHQILHDVFGFSSFRGVQGDVVDRVMAGRNTLAVMPTGAGKSLCYQLPAVAKQGTCIVISPLIALMQDQVRSATENGMKAASLTSLSDDWRKVQDDFVRGDLDLLYVAPERATTDGFGRLLEQARISLFAIDEAHCVSEWGHDFRPDYRLLRPLLDHFGAPRLALTATADKRTRADILTQLGIEEEGLIVAGFDRPNIRYHVVPRSGLPSQLKRLAKAHEGAGIVYCPSRAQADRVAEQLRETGRTSGAYHAGLDKPVRQANQEAFVASEDMVMAATIAFGMGIDKPDVRFIAHAGVPKSIEAYYQETGRAGRDGEPAEAWLFWGAEDFARARQRIETETEEGRRHEERARLNAMAAFVEAATCRRAILLKHFGEDPPEICGNCDNCIDPPPTIDVTVVAQKLLSAAFRTEMRFGVGHLADVLAGKETEKVISNGHNHLSVFGIAEDEELALIKPVARSLLARDALRADSYGGLSFGPAAKPILIGGEKLVIAVPPKRKAAKRTAADYPHDPGFEALRAWRRDIATEQGVPPYVVFHDSTLRAVAATRPTTLAMLSQIEGVGDKKLEKYGSSLLKAVEDIDANTPA
ncbi:DNA helicase RecQ [Sphingomicrobium marinum]|uniref:DNA helicase RecQ n=1 Tax=Sphingomicrobium marinum TaxID=1227950 RepID=UPI0022400C0B|nr:DNA helicase RecQ [Sphingomicrobium marinum]